MKPLALVAGLFLLLGWFTDLHDRWALALLYAGASFWADWFFGRRARRKLLTELRVIAEERYSGGDPQTIGWRRLGRSLGQRWGRLFQERRDPAR